MDGIIYDISGPVFEITGNKGTYFVDESIDIQCKSQDDFSGTDTLALTLKGDAYIYNPGVNTFMVTALDKAGNQGTGTITFTVNATYEGILNLTKKFVTNAGVSKLLCSQLDIAKKLSEKNSKLKDAAILVYITEVLTQRGKTITYEQAVILIKFAGAL